MFGTFPPLDRISRCPGTKGYYTREPANPQLSLPYFLPLGFLSSFGCTLLLSKETSTTCCHTPAAHSHVFSSQPHSFLVCEMTPRVFLLPVEDSELTNETLAWFLANVYRSGV